MRPEVLFVDRDGTLVEEPADEQVDALDKIRLVPGSVPALLALSEAGYRLVMVSNQDGLGTESFPEADFRRCQDFILELFASQGVRFDEVFVCPHRPEDGCACRKPGTALVSAWMTRNPVDPDRSAVIGDRDTDLAFAENLGLQGFRLGEDLSWADIAHQLLTAPRTAELARETAETRIRVALDLDRGGDVTVETGIGFYDHMLTALARHGGFSLRLSCDGDLDVDPHHTVEDCAIALGQALDRALGSRRGIGRFGFVLPMDESRAEATVDLSGRPYRRFEGEFRREAVGGLPTELVPHVFRSLAENLRAAIHLRVDGEDEHHKIEACFKALGRALRPALARGDRAEMPSTKGVLA